MNVEIMGLEELSPSEQVSISELVEQISSAADLEGYSMNISFVDRKPWEICI